MEKRSQADLVIYLFDVNEMSAAELAAAEADFKNEGLQYLLVGNKADGTHAATTEKFNAFKDLLFISAKERLNIDALKKRLIEAVAAGGINTEATLVTNTRHYEALQKLDLLC